MVEVLFSPDYVQHNPAHGDVRGIEGAKRTLATLRSARPDLHITIHEMVMEGDTIALHIQ